MIELEYSLVIEATEDLPHASLRGFQIDVWVLVVEASVTPK